MIVLTIVATLDHGTSEELCRRRRQALQGWSAHMQQSLRHSPQPSANMVSTHHQLTTSRQTVVIPEHEDSMMVLPSVDALVLKSSS